MSRDPDSVALDAANNIVHAIDEMAFPGGDVQLKAHIQCIVYDAIHRANTPDSAAQGAMTLIDKDDLRNILDDIRKQNCPAMDDARKTIEGWLLADLLVVQSGATAQPIDLTGERIAIQKIRELCKASVMVTTYDVEQILDALANTAQGKPRNFCADCGKRTPEGSIHTCAPAYAVEQADHIGSSVFARDIYRGLGYVEWRNFSGLVDRAKNMIANGVAVGEIINTSRSVGIGSGSFRIIDDYELDVSAYDLVKLLAQSFKLNGHHIARNETIILGMVKHWCESKGITAIPQGEIDTSYSDLLINSCISIEFDENHHEQSRQLGIDKTKDTKSDSLGIKTLRFSFNDTVIDIILAIEKEIANKMVPPEPSAAMLDAAVAFALNVSLHSGYGWTDYMRDLWKVMMQANQREAHISHNSAHNDAAKKG